MPAPDTWLYHYQTLVTGAAAIGAALIAAAISRGQLNAAERQITVAREQMADTRRQADRDRASRLRAARASLPTALSSICSYATAAGLTLRDAWPMPSRMYPTEGSPEARYIIRVDLPEFPAATFLTLERVVEFTSAEDVANRIETLLREVQQFEARASLSFSGQYATIDRLAAQLVHAARIYAMAESMFGYARGEHEGLREDAFWARVENALEHMGVNHPAVAQRFLFEREADGILEVIQPCETGETTSIGH